MESQRQPTLPRSLIYKIALILGILAGLSLRLYQLGNDSLWNDEINTIKAAFYPTLHDSIQYIRYAPFSMPLDYLIAWVSAKLSLSEFMLRLPYAIWGTATLYVCYLLFKKVYGDAVALLGVWLLVLSPLHIHYSQELRFYAPLVFFYCLSTYLLFRGIEFPSNKNLLLASLVLIVGAGFHLFVLFSFVNGFFWWLFNWKKSNKHIRGLLWLVASAYITLLAVLPALWYFETGQLYNYPLFTTGETVWDVIGIGLGWKAELYTFDMVWGKLFGIFCMLFFAIGALHAFTKSFRSSPFLIGVFAQTALLFGIAILVRHPITNRYLLFLHPLAVSVSAYGCVQLCAIVGRLLSRGGPRSVKQPPLKVHPMTALVQAVLIGGLLFSVLPAIRDYYRWTKSNARGVSELVLQYWIPGDYILVAPGYDNDVYEYYLERILNQTEAARSVISIEVDYLPQDSKNYRLFFVYTQPLTYQWTESRDVLEKIAAAGFTSIDSSTELIGYHSLFYNQTIYQKSSQR